MINLDNIPTVICGRNFRMNPDFDDVIRGSELQENMVILIEDRNSRPRTSEEGSISAQANMARILDMNRWCIVTRLVKNDSQVSFVGVYCDGNKAFHICEPNTAWYVKYWSAPELLDEKNLREDDMKND